MSEKKYFNVNTLHNKKLGVKYVITLDTDTRLVLNSALNLVGAMAHPLNKPILNKKNVFYKNRENYYLKKGAIIDEKTAIKSGFFIDKATLWW